MKPLSLTTAALVAALCSLPCRAEIKLTSEIASGFTRDEGVTQFSDEVATNGISADIGNTGFSLGSLNLTEVGNGDKGFERGGGNENIYSANYTDEIDNKYSWGLGIEYEDLLAKDADDLWSIGFWGKKKLNDFIAFQLSLERKFETASDTDPDGYSVITLSTPMKYVINTKFSVPFAASISYNEGPSRLDAALIAKGVARLNWQVSDHFVWSIIKVTAIGTLEHVHDERNGKFRTNYATAVSYTF